MYQFIARYENLDTGVVITKEIDIDCTPLDAECMGGLPEEQFAWKFAAIRAWDAAEKNFSLKELLLLAM